MPEQLVHIMQYRDLRLSVDIEPDNNDCMWLTLFRLCPQIVNHQQRFDMKANEVRKLRDACQAFLDKLAAQA